jgi:NnrS protein
MPNATVLAHEDQHGRAQMSTPRLRRYDGPAILSYGFRPFFLLGSIYSGLAILVWLPVFRGELELASALTPGTGTSTKCCTGTCRP